MSGGQVVIPITMGMDEGTDPKVLPAGRFKYLENVRILKNGQIVKRNGYSSLGSSSFDGSTEAGTLNCVVPNPSGNAYNLVIAGERACAYSSTASRWNETNRMSAWVPTGQRDVHRFSEASGGTGQDFRSSVASTSGYTMVAVQEGDTANSYVYVIDDASQTVLFVQQVAGRFPQCVAAGTYLAVVYTLNSDIIARTFNTASLGSKALSSATTIATQWTTNQQFAAKSFTSSTFLLAYRFASTTVIVATITASTLATAAQDDATCLSENLLINVAGNSSGGIFVAWVEITTGNVKVASWSGSLTGPQGPITVIAADTSYVKDRPALGMKSTSTGYLGLSQARSSTATETGGHNLALYSLANGPLAATAATGLDHFRPASDPFAPNTSGTSGTYMWGVTDRAESAQRRNVLLNIETGEVEMIANEGVAACGDQQALPGAAWPANVAQSSDSTFLWTAAVIQSDLVNSSVAGVGIRLHRFRHSSSSKIDAHRPSVAFNGVVAFAGGAPSFFDGMQVRDLGFPKAPSFRVTALGGGSMTPSTTYRYTLTFRTRDAQGNVIESAPSEIKSVTLGGAQGSVSIDWSNTNFSRHKEFTSLDTDEQPEVRIWRAGGTAQVFQLVAIKVGLTTYTDDAADSTLADNEVIYTQVGNELANDDMPACRYIALSGNRLFVGGLWKADQVRVSKLIYPGYIPGFPEDDAFSIVVPGAVTALASLDGVPVVFTADGAYVVPGDGPDDAGNGAFGDPRRLPDVHGCVDHRSVVEIAQGLLYQSRRGIEMLPRGFGAPVFLGERVQTTLASFPVVTSASVVERSTDVTVRFTLVNSDTSPTSGVVLVLDQRTLEWSVDEYASNPALSAAVWDGVFTWATVNSTAGVRQESSAYSDGGFFIGSFVELGDVRPFGIEGHGRIGRIYMLGEYKGNCAVTVSLSYDSGVYDAAYDQTWTFNSASDAALLTNPQIDPVYELRRQRVDQLRIKISDAAVGGTPTQGVVFNALVLDRVRPALGARRPQSTYRKA